MSPVTIAVLAGVLVPTFVVLAIWVGTTVYRLLSEGPTPTPFQPDPALRREGVRVGAREIRAELRHRERHGRTPAYHFEKGTRTGLPSAWMQDAARRCN